jgi:adenylate cyclase
MALFLYGGILANGVRTVCGIVLAMMALTIQKYTWEERERIFLRARFENYFAPALLDKILASRDMLETCERKTVTILFSDIVGFTPWSATRSPEEVHRTLNEYFKAMTAIVFKHEGTVDKYIGDGLMAFFGDPVAHPDHAARAVRTAEDMQHKARELRTKWMTEGRMDLKVRVGVHTGEAIVGNMGSEKRVDYTAIGASVNLAQRLETNAPEGGILISRSVYDVVREIVRTKPAGRIKAKGFGEEIEVFEIVTPDF